MSQTSIKLCTSLTVKECERVFRRGAPTPGRLLSATAKGLGNDPVSFCRPVDNSVFDDEVPTSCVGCRIARMGSGGAAGNMTDVQMSVWDRGTHRDVLLVSEFRFGAGGQSKKAVAAFVRAFMAADKAAKVG